MCLSRLHPASRTAVGLAMPLPPASANACLAPWREDKVVSHCFSIAIFFFWFGFYSPSRLFCSFSVESIVRWGENGRSPRKNTRPPQAELGFSHIWPKLGSNQQWWDDERFKALNISVRNHSATGDAWQARIVMHLYNVHVSPGWILSKISDSKFCFVLSDTQYLFVIILNSNALANVTRHLIG